MLSTTSGTPTRTFFDSLLEYLELILTAAGTMVVALAFTLFRDVAPWKAATCCALCVSVLHGIIFFVVRTAQRRARRRAAVRIRQTVSDLVRNKLQVVLFTSAIADMDWRPAAQQAVEEIEQSLRRIENESIHAREMPRIPWATTGSSPAISH